MKRLTLELTPEAHRLLPIEAATAELMMADLGRALIRDCLDADEGRQGRLHDVTRDLKAAS